MVAFYADYIVIVVKVLNKALITFSFPNSFLREKIMRNTRFLAQALATGLTAANEEHAPDAGDMVPNDSAAAAQNTVQGVDAVAQAQIEPVVAAAGGEQGSEGKPSGGEESTVEVPDVDSVAQLQEHIGALEEQAYETDQQELQMVSNQFEEELGEATDVVASLENLGQQIQYALEHNEVNYSTNAAFYSSMMESVKRSGIYSQAALEAEGDMPLLPNEVSTNKGAETIGQKVKNFASTAGKAIVEGITKFLAWVQDVVAKFTTGAASLQKKFENFEKTGLQNLTGGEVNNKMLIQRLKLVQGSGDAPAQFNAFIRFCTERLMKTLAGPLTQLLHAVNVGTKDAKVMHPVNENAIDRMIQLLYSEGVENADLEGKSEIGTDWAQGSTGSLLGGLRAWIASNHNVVESIGQTKIEAGISRNVPTETPETIAGADANSARSDIRAIVSILRNWNTLNMTRRMANIMGAMTAIVGDNKSYDTAESSGGEGTATVSEVLRQYSQILRGFAGQNTLSLIRHMLYTFNLYHAYLQASAQKQEAPAGAGGELQTA